MNQNYANYGKKYELAEGSKHYSSWFTHDLPEILDGKVQANHYHREENKDGNRDIDEGFCV